MNASPKVTVSTKPYQHNYRRIGNMARRPRFRTREQVSEQRRQRVQRALERVEAAESTSANEEPAEQLSDETHIPEDNRFTGTLRIDDDGMAYLNDRPLGIIEEVTQGESIGDAGDHTMRTSTIQARHIEVSPEARDIAEELEALRTFTYRPYEPANLDSIQVTGRLSPPDTNHLRSQFITDWLATEHRAQPTITTEPMQVRNLVNEIPQPDGEIPATDSVIGGPIGEHLLVGGSSIGRTGELSVEGGGIRINQDGIAIPRHLTFTGDESDARRLAREVHASIDATSIYGDYSTGRIARSKSYTFDEEKVNTLMDTIRVVRAIMTKYHFREEDVKKLGIEDLMREL